VFRAFSLCVGAIRRVWQVGTVLAFSVLFIVTMLQVVGRLPWFDAPIWTEEIARFSQIYLVAFSCGLAMFRGELVSVDLFVGLLPPRGRRIVSLLAELLVIAFSLLIVPGSWNYVLNGIGEGARSINLSMVWIYLALMIIPLSLVFFTAAKISGCQPPADQSQINAVPLPPEGVPGTGNSESGSC